MISLSSILNLYLQFEVRNALSLSEEVMMDDRVLKIQRCKPLQNIWDYAMDMEPNKIYVSNLPQYVMKKHLRNAFLKVAPYTRLIYRYSLSPFIFSYK